MPRNRIGSAAPWSPPARSVSPAEPQLDAADWKALDFPPDEYAERHARTREAMRAADLDLLLVINPRNLNYLIGFAAKSYQEFQCLLFPREPGPLTMFTRLAEVTELSDLTLADAVHGYAGRVPEDPIEALTTLIDAQGFSRARIGLEVPDVFLSVRDYLKITSALSEATVVDATGLILGFRAVKSPRELALIRRAAGIADVALLSTVETIAAGMSELEVVGELYRALLAAGSDLPGSSANFGTGERTCYAHAAPTDRRIEQGDPMMLEFGASYHRYVATLGRDLSLGTPSARLRELHDVQVAACDALIASVRPGISSAVPHAAARKVIEDAGWDHGRVHTSGYGLATTCPPTFGEGIHFFDGFPYLPRTIEAGMVLSVEPPIFSAADRLGARVIDNIVVTQTGCELLSAVPREILAC
jgi:Xaa-Pro dipeptidase